MSLYVLDDKTPTVHDTAYVAPGATVIGLVELHDKSSVWPGAVLRGDNEPIVIGEGANVQDGAIIHTDPGSPATIEAGVTVGHQAMLHGCTVGEGSIVGIQAVILNNAVIGKYSLVGADALVTEGKGCPERSLILGTPAKVVRTLSDEEVAGLRENAASYVTRAQEFKQGLKPL